MADRILNNSVCVMRQSSTLLKLQALQTWMFLSVQWDDQSTSHPPTGWPHGHGLEPTARAMAKNYKCDKTQTMKMWGKKTQKLKMWQNSKTQIVTKFQTTTPNVTKPKNSTCYKTYKLKLWQNSTTQNVAKLKMWKNSKTLNVTKLKNSKGDKT